jgi:DNA repair exonuclease SbcCD ATPase subunit
MGGFMASIFQAVGLLGSSMGMECNVCQHPVGQHSHWRAVWKEHEETQIRVDEGMKAKWESAKEGKAKHEAALEAMRQTLADVDRVVEGKMVKLADLAEEYGKMALSGSFSAHLECGISLLEMHLASSRESNTDSEQMKRLEENVAGLKRKLDVLKEANSLKQKAKNSGHLKKRWDNLKGWDLANRAIQWTTGPVAGAQPQLEWRD